MNSAVISYANIDGQYYAVKLLVRLGTFKEKQIGFWNDI